MAPPIEVPSLNIPGTNEMSEPLYFAVPYRLDRAERCLVCYRNGQDGVLLLSAGRIATFASVAAARAVLAPHGIALQPEPESPRDFDLAETWSRQPQADAVDCEHMRSLLDLIFDIADSAGIALPNDDDMQAVYDKLYWGSSASQASASPAYRPIWSEPELAVLARMLSTGIAGFRQATRSPS